MAISKERKEEVLTIYADWMKRSQAVILVEYTGVKMKDLDAIRSKIRESGGEFHIVKNTLARRAFADSGMELPEDFLIKSTAISFAFTDPALTAKALNEAVKGKEAIKVKGGYMSGQALNPVQVKALADMPPLPVVRAQLLGVLQAPAGNSSVRSPNLLVVWRLLSKPSLRRHLPQRNRLEYYANNKSKIIS